MNSKGTYRITGKINYYDINNIIKYILSNNAV